MSWYENNREKASADNAAWRKANPESVRASYDRWKKNNPVSYRICQFNSDIHKKYGLRREDWDRLLIEHSGRCANPACRKPLIGSKEPHVDHRHVEGFEELPAEEKRKLVRGLLCRECNLGIGYFEDDPELLQGALEYLKR